MENVLSRRAGGGGECEDWIIIVRVFRMANAIH